jgi:hypothetical protein
VVRISSGDSETQVELLEERYGELSGALDGNPERVEIEVFRAPRSDFRELEPAPGRSYDMDLDYLEDSVRVAAPNMMGRVTLAPLRAAPLRAALWTPVEEPLDEVVGVFENFFRLIVDYRLNHVGGALLHSASLVRDSRAYLFLGRSGAGKSTISRISQEAGAEVLSDDMNALVLEQGRATVEKLPFAGNLGQTGRRRGGVSLAGLYRLEPAEAHALEPFPEPEALALLLSCAPFLNADPHRTDRLMENLAALAQSCDVKKLAFRRDAGFWDLIAEASSSA